MSMADNSTGAVLSRLQTLFLKLDDEGLYVSANTVILAMEEIKRLSAEETRTRPVVKGRS